MAYAQSEMMKRRYALPMVPGMTCGEELLRRNYGRSQLLDPTRHRVTAVGTTLPADCLTESVVDCAGAAPDASNIVSHNATTTVDLTGRVLRFYAFAVESVRESTEETVRVRKVVLHYFLEDGTMSLLEPAEDNSGIEFRANLKRHRIPRADGSPIAVSHLRVGEPLTFYGRTYLLYDADAFTRKFYEALGHAQPAAHPVPVDAHRQRRWQSQTHCRHDAASSIAAASPLNNVLTPAQVRATQQFLALDRQVLRCDCTWDDSESLYGTTHYLTLNYFLADGSLAIVEKEVPNSGRDGFPMFVRRQRVARVKTAWDAEDGRRAAAGKFDSSTLGSVMFDHRTVAESVDYYTDADIRIGNTLNIYGRLIKIHDYNAFTREHLRKKFGIANETPLPGATPPPYVAQGAARKPAAVLRSRPSSAARCDRLLPDQPSRQRHALAESRRGRGADTVVKFLMRMDHASYHDSIRRFVLTVYLVDDTLSIYEPVVRNSGIIGGKFLQRQRVLSSGEVEHTTNLSTIGGGGDSAAGDLWTSSKSNRHGGRYYSAADFYVGARIRINTFCFVLIASNEHTLNYMEMHASDFAHASMAHVVAKLQSMLYSRSSGLAEALRRADETQSTGVELAVLMNVMQQLGLEVSEHELLTVLRYFDRNKEYYVSYEEMAARIMPEGAAVGCDDRTWQEIYAMAVRHTRDGAPPSQDEQTSPPQNASRAANRSACDTTRFLPVDDAVMAQARTEQDVARAAAAATEFDALYAQRRQLFVKEFGSIGDYARDGCIGAEEFARCMRKKLHIHSIDDAHLEALCAVLFAPPYSRLAFEDLLRIFNNTSTLPRNMEQIKDRTAA